MRFVILLLIVLIVSPAFGQDNARGNNVPEKAFYNNVHHEPGVCLSVFLNENSEDENKADDKTLVPTAELIDFTFLTTLLTQYHSRFLCNASSLQVWHEPLFKLNCIFLI